MMTRVEAPQERLADMFVGGLVGGKIGYAYHETGTNNASSTFARTVRSASTLFNAEANQGGVVQAKTYDS